MIKGIGLDIEEIQRIRRIYQAYGERFVKKILSAGEISLMPQEGDPVMYLAGRFGAKEAFFKAVASKKTLKWKDVQILKGELGEPKIQLKGSAEKIMNSLETHSIWCSISHSHTTVAAMVIIE